MPETYADPAKKDYAYNSRLFSGGVRRWVHMARFNWLRRVSAAARCENVLELGCHDGMAIEYLAKRPVVYEGFDADQADGLTLARRWSTFSNYRFTFAKVPEQMVLSRTFDTAIALETLEHIPPNLLDAYLAKIAVHLNGYFFVSVPNEKGLVFLAKWLAKKAVFGRAQHYTAAEFVAATLGRMDRVARDDHKGFDYSALTRHLAAHFKIVSMDAMPVRTMPLALSPFVGIVAHSKH